MLSTTLDPRTHRQIKQDHSRKELVGKCLHPEQATEIRWRLDMIQAQKKESSVHCEVEDLTEW
jgi:hypothetical protein